MRHQSLGEHDLQSAPSIRRLRIGPSNLTVTEVDKLPRSLEYLDWDMGISVPEDSALIQLFQRLPCLKRISLRFRNREVLEVLKRNLPLAIHLRELDLRSNWIGDEGVLQLLEPLLQTKLTSLNLGFNLITDAGAASLAKLVSDEACNLTHLDLNCNLIGNDGGLALAKALKNNTTLKTLVLYGNAQVSCGRDFVDALRVNSSLSDCNLQRTQVYDQAMTLINYWLMLNKSGRRILKHDKLPSSVWPGFLEKRCQKDAMFFFLTQKPELIDKHSSEN